MQDFIPLIEVINLATVNDEIISIIMQALGYGFLAGFGFFIITWGTRLVLSIVRT